MQTHAIYSQKNIQYRTAVEKIKKKEKKFHLAGIAVSSVYVHLPKVSFQVQVRFKFNNNSITNFFFSGNILKNSEYNDLHIFQFFKRISLVVLYIFNTFLFNFLWTLNLSFFSRNFFLFGIVVATEDIIFMFYDSYNYMALRHQMKKFILKLFYMFKGVFCLEKGWGGDIMVVQWIKEIFGENFT